MTDRMQTVQGRCPACGWTSLFLGDGGHVTCSLDVCPNPSAVDELLHGDIATRSTNTLLDRGMVASAALYNGVLIRALHAEAELAALREVARGYCPACGRGDAAPTVTDWEQQRKRADQAEELLRIAHDTSNKSEAERVRAVQRAEQAEHRLRLAHQARRAKEQQLDGIRRALCDVGAMQDDDPYSHADLEDVIRQAFQPPTPAPPTETEATGHIYLSTGCLHGQHDYCKSNTGLAGAKKPSRCKWCDAFCQCPCHLESLQTPHEEGQ